LPSGRQPHELAFAGSDFSNIDVEIPNRISLELLPFGFVAVHIGQARDTMPLKTTVQRRPRQMRDRRLQSVEAVISRQKSMPPKGHNHCFLVFAKNG